MKNKIIIRGIYVLVIVLATTIAWVGSVQHEKQVCNALTVVLKNDFDNYFLDLETVKNIIRQANGSPIEGSKLKDINVAKLEAILRSNPYVRDAEVYKKFKGELVAEVTMRKPIARVMDAYGSGFYLDEEFYKVPLSASFSANVILVRGNFVEPISPADEIRTKELKTLKPLIEYIDNSEFLSSQLSELAMESTYEIVLYPEVGDVPVFFGSANNIEKKFSNLILFYKQVLNQVGWKKYASINLKYKDQIVAKKRSRS